jgi:hypothetical protein
VPRIDQLRLAWSPPEWVVATSCSRIVGRYHRLMGSRNNRSAGTRPARHRGQPSLVFHESTNRCASGGRMRRACYRVAPFRTRSSRRWRGANQPAPRRDRLVWLQDLRYQTTASRQVLRIPRAGLRVAARAGSRRLEIHCSGRASQEITKRIGRDEPASGNENGPKLAFADQDVKRTAR